MRLSDRVNGVVVTGEDRIDTAVSVCGKPVPCPTAVDRAEDVSYAADVLHGITDKLVDKNDVIDAPRTFADKASAYRPDITLVIREIQVTGRGSDPPEITGLANGV